MKPRLRTWWESLPARRQALLAYPVVTALLALVHIAFFHRITLARQLTYAIFEGVLVTAIVVAASQAEAARRRAATPPPGDDGGG